MTVQGVLPVQQAIQGESSTDVVQGKDAVGIPCKTEAQSHDGLLAEGRRVEACTPPQGDNLRRGQLDSFESQQISVPSPGST